MGEIDLTRNPKLHTFVQTNPSQSKAERLVQKEIKRPCQQYKTLPKTVPEIKELLLALKEQGLIIFEKDKIRGYLQNAINTSTTDTHLIFGTWHKNPGQHAYINSLLFGPSSQTLAGVTHIVLEFFGQGNINPKGKAFAKANKRQCNSRCKTQASHLIHGDLQHFLDLYHRYNSQGALSVLETFGKTFFNKYPYQTFQQMLNTVTQNHRYQNKYKILASDLSDTTEKALKKRYSEDFIIYELREYFATSYVLHEQNPSAKDVFAYIWGADHIDKYALENEWSAYGFLVLGETSEVVRG